MDGKKQNFEPTEEGRPEHARRLFLVVGILAVFGLIGGYWTLKTGIEQPLAFTNTTSSIASSSSTQNISDEATILSLQNKDTDKDGLTDYDELYKYGSSPYLADSDSDGIDDKTEVTNGDDPNCPTGTECTPIAVFSPSNTNSSTSANTNGSTQNSSTSNVDANQLRITLRNAGAPQAELDSLTDEELIALYQDVLREDSSTNTNADSNASIADTIDVTQLRDLSAAEIRQLLILGGVDADTLDELDDETLKAVFYEAVENIKTSDTNQ